MTWSYQYLSWGKKSELRRRLVKVADALPAHIVDGADFYLRGLRYQRMVCEVRLLIEYLNGAGYRINGCKKLKHCKLYKRICDDAHWAHHSWNDTDYGHYDVTDENQDRMIDHLRELLSQCGLLDNTINEDTDEGFAGDSGEDSRDDSGDDSGNDSGDEYDGSDGLCDGIGNLQLSDDEDTRPVCRFWQRGRCRFGDDGDGCSYRHSN
jgi:hypothetical protein